METNGTTTVGTLLSTQQVPWYSILWTLVAFGLNSMNQPAGCVIGCTTNVSSMLRSSPIVCAIDAVFLICGLVYYRWNSPSLDGAHARLLRLRFQDDIADDDDDHPRPSTTWTGRLTRWGALAMLLLQVIKFLSYHGLLWSKIIAGLFVASFVVTEVILYWPRSKDFNIKGLNPEITPAMSGLLSPCYHSIAFSVAFMLWFSATASRDIFGQPHDTLLAHLGLATSVLSALFIAFMFLINILEGKTLQEKMVSTALLAPLLGIPWAYYAASPRLTEVVSRPVFIQLTTAALSVGWVLAAVLFASVALKRIVNTPGGPRTDVHRTDDSKPDERERIVTRRKMTELTLAWYFLALHILTAALYLLYSYDSAGTWRPRWSEPLG